MSDNHGHSIYTIYRNDYVCIVSIFSRTVLRFCSFYVTSMWYVFLQYNHRSYSLQICELYLNSCVLTCCIIRPAALVISLLTNRQVCKNLHQVVLFTCYMFQEVFHYVFSVLTIYIKGTKNAPKIVPCF